jgi:hypothetical protein
MVTLNVLYFVLKCRKYFCGRSFHFQPCFQWWNHVLFIRKCLSLECAEIRPGELSWNDNTDWPVVNVSCAKHSSCITWHDGTMDICTFYFPQDGEPLHFRHILTQFLNSRLSGRWIGRGGRREWSLWYPDLTRLHLGGGGGRNISRWLSTFSVFPATSESR